MSFFQKSGIVNVKMVITEEKILSNIDKVQKLINPNSKKQIVQLEDDSYFKDLVESIKTYLLEYPKKKNFPRSVYKASYDLVEYATNQFEENTKKVEDLIRQREKNIKSASILREATNAVKNKVKNWKEIIKKVETKYPEDVVQALLIIGKSKEQETEEYVSAVKLIDAKIGNLESNLHIEIDMERIEDRSKALSYIGIEIAEALKYIPAPVEGFVSTEEVTDSNQSVQINNSVLQTESTDNGVYINDVEPEENLDTENYFEETRFNVKPTLWQRIKNSKFVRTLKYIMNIKVVLDYPALPEGREEWTNQ